MSENLPGYWPDDDDWDDREPEMEAVEFDQPKWARTGGVPISWIALRAEFRDALEGHHLDAPSYIATGSAQYHDGLGITMVERELEDAC